MAQTTQPRNVTPITDTPDVTSTPDVAPITAQPNIKSNVDRCTRIPAATLSFTSQYLIPLASLGDEG